MVMFILLVLFFGSSSNLAAAYGIAVTGAMFIDTCLMSVVLFALWKWPAWKALPLLAIFFVVDIAYFGANLIKVPDGGWVPLAIGRSEEHTSELQSLMRISYAVFCLKKKTTKSYATTTQN